MPITTNNNYYNKTTASSFIIPNKKQTINSTCTFKQPLQTTISSGRSYNHHHHNKTKIQKTQLTTMSSNNTKSRCKIKTNNNNRNWFTYTSASGVSHKVIVNNNKRIENHDVGNVKSYCNQQKHKSKHQLKLDQKHILNLKNSNTLNLRHSKSKSKDIDKQNRTNPSKSQSHSRRQSLIFHIDNHFGIQDENKQNIPENIMKKKDDLRVFEKDDLNKLRFVLEREMKQGKTLSKKKWLAIVDNNNKLTDGQRSERENKESLQKLSANQARQIRKTMSKSVNSNKKPISSARSRQIQHKKVNSLNIVKKKSISNLKHQQHQQSSTSNNNTIINNNNNKILQLSKTMQIKNNYNNQSQEENPNFININIKQDPNRSSQQYKKSFCITQDQRNYSIKSMLNTLVREQQQQQHTTSDDSSKDNTNKMRKIQQCLTTDDNDAIVDHHAAICSSREERQRYSSTTMSNNAVVDWLCIEQLLMKQNSYLLINQYESKIATLYQQLIQEKEKRYRLQDIIETYIAAKDNLQL